MKAATLSDPQKAFVLKHEADGMPVADICRKAASTPAACASGLHNLKHSAATLQAATA